MTAYYPPWNPFDGPLAEVFRTALMRHGLAKPAAIEYAAACAAVMERTPHGLWRPKPFDEWPGCAP